MIDQHQGKKKLILSVWVARQTDRHAGLALWSLSNAFVVLAAGVGVGLGSCTQPGPGKVWAEVKIARGW